MLCEAKLLDYAHRGDFETVFDCLIYEGVLTFSSPVLALLARAGHDEDNHLEHRNTFGISFSGVRTFHRVIEMRTKQSAPDSSHLVAGYM